MVSGNNSIDTLLRTGESLALRGSRCNSPRVPEDSKCKGCPPMYKGKLCSSTTRYNNQNLGACGCGNQYRSDAAAGITRTLPLDYWTLTSFTAALNCKNLDPDDPSLAWCPTKCGSCYELCSTGGLTQSAHGNDRPSPGVCKVFKVVDRCGDGYDNPGPNWCSQQITWQQCLSDPSGCKKAGNTNWFGYPIHFDLQDSNHQILAGLGWDNIEVTFEPVSCEKWVAPDDVETCTGCEF